MSFEDTQKELTLLRRKRGVIKASLTRIRNFVREFDPTSQASSLLEFRQEELPQINKKFDAVQGEIELLAEDTVKEEEERDLFERDYFDLRSQIQELVNVDKSRSSVGRDGVNGSFTLVNRTRLAPIPLSTFNGDIQAWESFFDIFKAMVHNDEGYSPAQKFYYLRSCLTGPALDLVGAIPVSEANYDVIIQKLQQRYDNRSLIIQSHIRSMLDSPRVEKATAKALQSLHSHISTHIAALRALKQPIQHWDAWLITIITSRLDKETGQDWQLFQTSTELPKYDVLERFLASRCVALENAESYARDQLSSSNSLTQSKGHKSMQVKKGLLATETEISSCVCCTENHKLNACESFKKLTVGERLSKVRDARLCFNCLSPYHVVTNCKSKGSCNVCKKKHNSLLHLDTNHKRNPTQGSTVEDPHNENTNSTTSGPVSMAVTSNKTHVFLASVLIFVLDRNGNKRQCRAVLDSGSQVNFVSRGLLNKLQLPSKKTKLPIQGIGSSQVHSTAVVDIQIISRVRQFKTVLTCHVLPVVVGEFNSCAKPAEGWKIPSTLMDELADPAFDRSNTVDLLIGGGMFYDLLEAQRVRLENSSLSLQNTKFGWIITGEIGMSCLLALGSSGKELEENWVALRENEDDLYGLLSKSKKKDLELQRAVDHFMATAKRNSDGRFVLRLPVKDDISELGDSFNMARNRFLNVERRLQRDALLRLEYIKFMDDYLKMGHMQQVVENGIVQRNFYLPHHAVIKGSSLTTKVRVVFDASAKSSSGLSLNDVLLCGHSIQDDVFTILCRFRKHLYVITADVEKMYRQVAVAEEDCDLQRIVWRASPTEELRSYRLLTVTYGTSPASYMATQCLVSLAEEFEERFPQAAIVIKKDFYMDDLMTGADEEEDCLVLHRDITSIMDSAKFPLRKWCSNSAYLREKLGKNHNDPLFALEIGDEDMVKSLGLCWRPVTDDFRFSGLVNSKHDELTKRVILSDLNKVFDPLGFLTPILIKGKIFLQQLWQMKANWDSKLSREIQDKWHRFYNDLEDLRLISIPRSSKLRSSCGVEIYGFCDASIEAYGACIYVRTKDEHGRFHTRLLCSRSPVAPLKGATIPRLELCGALLLSKLAVKVAESWNIPVKAFRLWTDSTIVLSWLNCQGNQLKIYVANRVNQILELTDTKQWNHVRTNENPADVISRGIRTRELMNLQMWWYGPSWLSRPEGQWNLGPIKSIPDNELPERRVVRLVLAGLIPSKDLVSVFSDWQRLLRATAWLAKFVEYCRSARSCRVARYLTVAELRKSEQILVRRAQQDAFHEEFNALGKDLEVSRSSKLSSLRPRLQEGLIVVGGRLQNANISDSQKYPVVLPPDHKIKRLLFQDHHRAMLHFGPQLLLASIRRRFWPLRGRVLARATVAKCVNCIRAKPKFEAPLMAPLPKDRVQPSRTFSKTGVDFAGPVTIRSGMRRSPGKKAWIAIFVCLVTRAIHIEAVEELTSSAFIAALRRFMSRRGKCATIYSDNGTNFVAANKELNVYLRNVDHLTAQDGISWHFNPPSAPHFGGLWESAVKSTKHHLTRVVKDAKLTLSELTTLLCQIEACVNSRPMTPLSSDPADLQPLTPAHFLIGEPMLLHPEPDLTSEQPTGLRRWRYVQYLMQTFWSR